MALALLLASAIGCRDKSTGEEQKQPEQAAAAPSRARAAEPKGPTAASARTDALALLERWAAAQRALDFDAYIALYEPSTFRGVKRTSKGGVRDLDLAGWRADRKRMFDRKFEIAVEPLGVETWLDQGSKLKRGMSIVRFTQRWKSASYADHGVKVLHAWRAPDGALRITYEDLLNSEPGWDLAAGTAIAIDLPVPTSPAAALALWRKLAPTGKDYLDKLASIPSDPKVREPMALALLADGNLACAEVVDYDECGLQRREWKELDPSADLADPCLRRRLALWAIAQASGADLATIQPNLTAMAGLEVPEQEIQLALAHKMAGDDVPESLELAVDEALDAAGREETIDIDGLSDAGLVALTARGVDQAALALDPASHAVELAKVLVGDELIPDTRREVFSKISDQTVPAVTAALEQLTSDADCELAMLAAEVLAGRGDPGGLPRQKPGLGAPEAEHALCMIRYDSDEVRQGKRLAEFIPREGIELEVNEIGGPPEDAGPGEETPDLTTDLESISTALSEYFDERAEDSDRGSLFFSADKGGPLLLRSITRVRYLGCDC